MTRAVYLCLVWLHPPSFRRRFAEEMTWIFDEASSDIGGATFLADGFSSLLRQWARNPWVWKILAIGLGNVPLLVLGVFPAVHRPLVSRSVFSAPDFFVLAALAPLVTISISLIFAVSWFRFVQRRRS
jgi:hypothetical protein